MTVTKKTIHGEWSSRFAFILAATGSAVGLGNIWKFPYITGENGGGAFVFVYLLCVALIGVPIMMSETMLGRRTRQDPIDTMRILAEEAGADSRWQYLGWLGVTAGLLILSYYSVIAGWSSAYVLKAFNGSFFDADASAIKNIFDSFVESPLQLIFWHSLFMAATMLIVVRGVHDGLEHSVRLLMPGLFILMVLLLAYAMSTSGYFQGLKFLIHPDFSKLTADSILIAMGQAFFTLSLGMGSVMVYGSYLSSEVSIAKASYIIAAADTIVALLAGLIIFPIVFTHGLHPDSGPGLIFKTLPIAFGSMTGGWLFGILFFLVLTIAALTSSIALIEPAVAWLVENKGFSREKACTAAGLAAWFLGLGTVFSFNVWNDFRIFGRSFFELLDYLTANLMLPIGGFCIAFFSGWIMHRQDSEQELNLPTAQAYEVWKFLVCYVAPVAVFLVFLNAVGVV
jgi:NSS family neurotransmitter:Na+ symporter